ncbi:MAG TPA: DUF3160 domain-containing protein [Polyangia bacterium]|nr:DUF3160 domain-containing protein [Polyangia bacterium]
MRLRSAGRRPVLALTLASVLSGACAKSPPATTNGSGGAAGAMGNPATGGSGIPTPGTGGAAPGTGGATPGTGGSGPSDGGSGPSDGGAIVDGDPGQPTTTKPSASEQAERDRVAAALTAVKDLDAAGLMARYPSGVSASATLGYDPLKATNLSLITSSRLGLSTAEKDVLGKNGFVISDRMRFPGFTYGYDSIYADDLPLFVSADSILYAVHRSYDALLAALETASLRPTLQGLLQGMRDALQSDTVGALGPEVAADLDLYLAVPLGLLTGTAPAPVAGASSADIAAFLQKANAASGVTDISLFGVTRTEDFSQFTPRGHYTDSPALTTYFKAMIWLGRFDQRMIETKNDGSQVFRRRQFDGALGMSQLLGVGTNQARWNALDTAIGAFVGESDSMKPTEFPALLAKLGASDLAAVKALDDATISAALVTGNFGAQRIASHVMIAGVHDQAFPLSRSFLLLGQRYVVDSHVFSNVVYDRVPPSTTKRLRMLPDPLDVAFAAMGNNQAATLLTAGLNTFEYAPALASMRVLVDEHGDDYWGANLYNGWLSALRALTPTAGGQSGPFSIASTEPWGRRLLNTQLASWAELRHDTILYVKQSYSGGVTCAFPDALVEPNPAFFGKLADLATKGQAVAAALEGSGTGPTAPTVLKGAADYFQHLGMVAATLKGMAEAQAAGTPFSAEQMAFINETVKVQLVGCGSKAGVGWYPKLFFSPDNAIDFHPTIADVHTAPTDEAGGPVGNVVHVGTGWARLMVVTANTCEGPKAYAGLASSYFEKVTQNFERIDDLTWNSKYLGTATDVAWMSGLIAR